MKRYRCSAIILFAVFLSNGLCILSIDCVTKLKLVCRQGCRSRLKQAFLLLHVWSSWAFCSLNLVQIGTFNSLFAIVATLSLFNEFSGQSLRFSSLIFYFV